MSNKHAVLVVFLMAALLGPGNLWATRSSSVQVKCPVCGSSSAALELMSTNNFGGFDTDFLPHAAGTSARNASFARLARPTLRASHSDFHSP